MPQELSLQVLPHEAVNKSLLQEIIAGTLGIKSASVTGFHITRQSVDARSRQPRIQLTAQVFVNEPVQARKHRAFEWKDVHAAPHEVHIIGAGPAGLFAALRLLELGIRPVILERGKDVRSRRRDLAQLNKEGILNPESNYCFGEGGAGTYSDGKLYTRSTKRGNVSRILELFHYFGADEKILYQSHPHIGTNKLPQIITAMREHIVQCGGKVHFEAKVTGFQIKNNRICELVLGNGSRLGVAAVLLATGHSARDIFELLQQQGIQIEAKPFALGVRVEHPQELIDRAQYHCAVRDPFLPPASYSLVQQVQGKGVFSFCMCPGGIIAPAATAPAELVVNGWSPSKRNNPYANSGMVVSVDEQDAFQVLKAHKQNPTAGDPLLLLRFQQFVERAAYQAGGGRFRAPAQRMTDFFEKKVSATLPDCSYVPGLSSTALEQVLPHFIHEKLRLALREFGKKMKGYFSQEAVVVATESRTSSPVRIPRTPDALCHPQIGNLYPCAEGAGYAGGIVSAAMDGEKVAAAIAAVLVPHHHKP